MIILAVISLMLRQGDVADIDNTKLLDCLSKQIKGENAKCSGLSSEFEKNCSFSVMKPSQRFIMANNEARWEMPLLWKYESLARQADFRTAIINKLPHPFKESQISLSRPVSSDGSRLEDSIRVENRIESFVDSMDSMTISLNYATGRITVIDLEMTGSPVLESITLSNELLNAKIKIDGPDYEIVKDYMRWVPQLYTTATAPNHRKYSTIVQPDGRVQLYKVRVVGVKRNSETKFYKFRMDGTTYVDWPGNKE